MSRKTVLRSEKGVMLIEATEFDDAGEQVAVGYIVKVPGAPGVETFAKESGAHSYFDDVVDRLKIAEGDSLDLR